MVVILLGHNWDGAVEGFVVSDMFGDLGLSLGVIVKIIANISCVIQLILTNFGDD